MRFQGLGLPLPYFSEPLRNDCGTAALRRMLRGDKQPVIGRVNVALRLLCVGVAHQSSNLLQVHIRVPKPRAVLVPEIVKAEARC